MADTYGCPIKNQKFCQTQHTRVKSKNPTITNPTTYNHKTKQSANDHSRRALRIIKKNNNKKNIN